MGEMSLPGNEIKDLNRRDFAGTPGIDCFTVSVDFHRRLPGRLNSLCRILYISGQVIDRDAVSHETNSSLTGIQGSNAIMPPRLTVCSYSTESG